MIYTKLTKKAMQICFEAHKDQTDKTGVPYVFHPFHLAEQMKDEITTIVALLHDVVEDSSYSLEDLSCFGDDVISALKLLTHDKSIPYFEYIENIKANNIAKTVKQADLNHNSDTTRLNIIDSEAIERIKKYEKAREILSSWVKYHCYIGDKTIILNIIKLIYLIKRT